MQLRDMHNNRMFNESNQSVQHIGFNATAHRSYFAIGNNFRLARRSRRYRVIANFNARFTTTASRAKG